MPFVDFRTFSLAVFKLFLPVCQLRILLFPTRNGHRKLSLANQGNGAIANPLALNSGAKADVVRRQRLTRTPYDAGK